MEEIQRSLSELITNQRAMLEAQSTLLASVYDKQVVDNKLNAKLNVTDFTAIKNAINMHLSQKSFAGNGYTKLPNGLILQWGKTNVSKVIFPIAFPTKVLSATCNTFTQSVLAVANCFNISNTGFESGGHYCTGPQWYSNSTIEKYWFAIGY